MGPKLIKRTFVAAISSLVFVLLSASATSCMATGLSAEATNAEVTASSPLVIAPFISGEYFDDHAVQDLSIKNEDQAALYEAKNNFTAANRIGSILDSIGPVLSPSGKYSLGYVLNIPLLRYFRKVGDEWIFDRVALKQNLAVIRQIDRPVVIYLSMNHFIDSNIQLARELARDPKNLMWNRYGPLYVDNYFGNTVVAWTLVDQTAPISIMRKTAFGAAAAAISSLPREARKKIVGISVLGEVHELFPAFQNGPDFSVPMYDATDYSPVAVNGFRIWLRQKYVDISKLNDALRSDYSDFGTVNPPSRDIRKEPLSSYFDHIDQYAAGVVPVYGWLYDERGRKYTISIILDGKSFGVAQTGLNRTDVSGAIATVKNPNVGFRLDLDYRNIPIGIHTLEVVVTVDGGKQFRLADQKLVIVDRRQDPPPPIQYEASPMSNLSSDSNFLGHLDGPAPLQSLFYNPLARLWLEYRNLVVRNYIEQFAQVLIDGKIPESKIFSHQITPNLNGSWNGDLLAVGLSQMLDRKYNNGATLYGGAAFGSAFLDMTRKLGWLRYSVSEMHPMVAMSNKEYLAMFEMHRKNGAVFVSPYYISIMPERLNTSNDLSSFRIDPSNKTYASDSFWQAIKYVMTQ